MKITILLFCTLPFFIFGQQMFWKQASKSGNSDGAAAIILLNDGNLLISGYAVNDNGYNSDFYAVKLSKTGQPIWEKTWGDSSFEYCNSVCEMPDNSLVMAGSTSADGKSDFLVRKTDEAGNLLWKKSYGGTGIDICRSCCSTSDGNILLCGYTTSFGKGENDIFLIKISPDGNLIWQRTFGGTATDLGYAILEGPDHLYYLAGTSGSFTDANKDAVLFKIDANGTEIWHRNFNSNNYDNGVHLAVSSTGEFFLTGYSDSHGTDLMDISVWAVDTSGNKKWYKYYDYANYYDYGAASCPGFDKGLIICGNSKVIGEARNFIRIIKADSTGAKLWERDITGSKTEWVNAVLMVDDSTFFIAGQSRSYGTGDYDAIIYKVNLSAPAALKDINMTSPDFQLYPNYPNPFNPVTTISFSLKSAGSASLKVFDVSGNMIEQLCDSEERAGLHSFKWDGKNCSSGIYFVELATNTGRAVRPVLLLK